MHQSTIKQQEIAYIEQDPNSARMLSRTEDHRSISNETPTAHRIPLKTEVHPSLLFSIYQSTTTSTRPTSPKSPDRACCVRYIIAAAAAWDEDGSTAVKKNRKWPWIVAAVVAVVAVVVVLTVTIIPSIVATRH